jgi:hypothetical protein
MMEGVPHGIRTSGRRPRGQHPTIATMAPLVRTLADAGNGSPGAKPLAWALALGGAPGEQAGRLLGVRTPVA